MRVFGSTSLAFSIFFVIIGTIKLTFTVQECPSICIVMLHIDIVKHESGKVDFLRHADLKKQVGGY